MMNYREHIFEWKYLDFERTVCWGFYMCVVSQWLICMIIELPPVSKAMVVLLSDACMRHWGVSCINTSSIYTHTRCIRWYITQHHHVLLQCSTAIKNPRHSCVCHCGTTAVGPTSFTLNLMRYPSSYSESFCERAQPMRDDVTMQRRLSLAVRVHKMDPAYLNRNGRGIPGVGVTKAPFVNFSITRCSISDFVKYLLDPLDHIHIWQVSWPLSWYSRENQWFDIYIYTHTRYIYIYMLDELHISLFESKWL